MKKAFIIVLTVIICLLSAAAGIAKLLHLPEEVEFFNSAGIPLLVMTLLGGLQVIAALALVLKNTRFYGALLAAVGFIVSAIIILLTGQLAFALVSIIPVVLSLLIAYFSKQGNDEAMQSV